MSKKRISPFLLAFILMIVFQMTGCNTGDTPATESKLTVSTPVAASTAHIEWDDRTIYAKGLIPEVHETLTGLPGATVYRIDIILADDLKMLQGHETVHYTNREDIALDALYFQLFPNIAGGKTTFNALKVDGQAVNPVIEYAGSAARVPLPRALSPGESIIVDIDFEVEIALTMAGNYGLFGYFDDVLVLDGFYPVIPVYDDEGWNVKVPPRNGDLTYLDASFYDVRVTAPAKLALVTSGVEVERAEQGSSQVVRFAAGPARDFYLAASRKFSVVSKTMGRTTVNSYALTGNKEAARLALTYAADALQHFAMRFGDYPYTEFDVVSTPMQALGIEYPGIVGITLEVYDLDAMVAGLPAETMMESVVAHEVAHQWFYNIVGSDQVDEPWLDEALVQYATGLYYVDSYGKAAAERYRLSWEDRWKRVDRANIPIGLPSGAYEPEAYSPIVYGRGPIFVTALADAMGDAAFNAFLRDYVETHTWGIATGTSFRQLAEKHCQCDLGVLFDTWVYGEETQATPELLEPVAPQVAVPTGEFASTLIGFSLEDFFRMSWDALMLRNPESILVEGLSALYAVPEPRLNDISDAYIRETLAMHRTILDILQTYDRDALTPEQQISYDVYAWYLEDTLRGEPFLYHDYPATFFITAVHEDLMRFFTDLHPLASKEDAQDYIVRLQQVDTKFEQLLEGLRKREEMGVIPPQFATQWALYGVRQVANASATRSPFYTSFRTKLNTLNTISTAEKNALLKATEAVVAESVLPAFQKLADYLEYLLSISTTDNGASQLPDGEAYYAYLLRHYTTTSLTTDEVHELGKQELARVHAEMRAVFDELDYPQDESLPELFARVAKDGGHVSGKQVLETYTNIIADADQKLGEAFDLRPTSKVIVIGDQYGGFYIAGAVDGSRPGAFYANVSGAGEDLFGMRTLAYHEAIPGHHFQISLAREANLPMFRNAMSFTGYVEGWALYAERLAWELGWYDDDPYGNLGRLQAEAFRAARLVVDTGIHTQGWTFEQAQAYLEENAGFDADFAQNQIARYFVWPGQATAYAVGMLRILELRQRAMDALGNRFDLKAFHNVMLQNGSMPLDVLEQLIQTYIDDTLASASSGVSYTPVFEVGD